MKKIAMFAAAVAIAFTGSANALTLKTGQVIANDGQVIDAKDSANVQKKLDKDGATVIAGVILVRVGDHTVEVPVQDVRGKSRDQIVEIIGEAAVEQLEDLHDAAEAAVAEIEANGGSAINAIGLTVEEEVAAILEGNADQIVGGTQAAADAIVALDPDTVHPDGSPEQLAAEAEARAANGH